MILLSVAPLLKMQIWFYVERGMPCYFCYFETREPKLAHKYDKSQSENTMLNFNETQKVLSACNNFQLDYKKLQPQVLNCLVVNNIRVAKKNRYRHYSSSISHIKYFKIFYHITLFHLTNAQAPLGATLGHIKWPARPDERRRPSLEAAHAGLGSGTLRWHKQLQRINTRAPYRDAGASPEWLINTGTAKRRITCPACGHNRDTR